LSAYIGVPRYVCASTGSGKCLVRAFCSRPHNQISRSVRLRRAVGFNEFAARCDAIAHQHGKDPSASAASSISTRLKARFRVHGGFPAAVASFHPSEPLDGVVGITGELLNQVSEFAIAIAVVVIASSLDFVQWRTGNVDVALLNQRSLIAIEKVNNSVRICAPSTSASVMRQMR